MNRTEKWLRAKENRRKWDLRNPHYRREYYLKHKEQEQKTHRAYYLKHRTELLIQQKKSRAARKLKDWIQNYISDDSPCELSVKATRDIMKEYQR